MKYQRYLSKYLQLQYINNNLFKIKGERSCFAVIPIVIIVFGTVHSYVRIICFKCVINYCKSQLRKKNVIQSKTFLDISSRYNP